MELWFKTFKFIESHVASRGRRAQLMEYLHGIHKALHSVPNMAYTGYRDTHIILAVNR